MPTAPDPLRHDPEHWPSQLREAIRAELRERGLSQHQLAEAMGKSNQYVSLKLTGQAMLRERDVQRFLEALDAKIVETPAGPRLVNRQTPVV